MKRNQRVWDNLGDWGKEARQATDGIYSDFDNVGEWKKKEELNVTKSANVEHFCLTRVDEGDEMSSNVMKLFPLLQLRICKALDIFSW